MPVSRTQKNPTTNAPNAATGGPTDSATKNWTIVIAPVPPLSSRNRIAVP